MSRPIDEMRVTLPQEVKQVYAGDLAAARQLGGREVRAGVPGEARAARVQEQRRVAEPPGLWKRFLNAIGIRRFTPEESYRARTHALSGKLRDVVTRLGTGHATKDALLGPMRDIASDIRTLALTVLSNDPQVEILIGQRRVLLERMQAAGVETEGLGSIAEESAAIERRIDAMRYDTEKAIVGARLEALVTPMSDEVLHRLHGVAEETFDRFRSQLPNRDPESDEIEALADGPMKDQELALRDREFDSYKQPMGLALSILAATEKELATRNPARAEPEAIQASASMDESDGTRSDRRAPEIRQGEINFSLADRVLEQFRNAAATPLSSGSEVFDATTQREIAGTNRFLIGGRPLVEAGVGGEQKIEALKEALTDLFGSQERVARFSRLIAGQGLNMLSGTLYQDTLVTLRESELENEYVLHRALGGAQRGDVETRLDKQDNGDVVATMNRRFGVQGFQDDNGHTHPLDPDSFIDVSLRIRIDAEDRISIDKPNSTLTYAFESPRAAR